MTAAEAFERWKTDPQIRRRIFAVIRLLTGDLPGKSVERNALMRECDRLQIFNMSEAEFLDFESALDRQFHYRN